MAAARGSDDTVSRAPPSASLLALLASLLVAVPAPSQSADSVRLDVEEAVLRELLTEHRLEQLRGTGYADYVCLDRRGENGHDASPPEKWLEGLEDSSPPVVSVSECRVMDAGEYMDAEPEPETSVHHGTGGATAILYRIGPVEWVRGDSARVRASYRVDPLHGETYECDVRRLDGQWTADCAVRFVS